MDIFVDLDGLRVLLVYNSLPMGHNKLRMDSFHAGSKRGICSNGNAFKPASCEELILLPAVGSSLPNSSDGGELAANPARNCLQLAAAHLPHHICMVQWRDRLV